jgi:alpha-galactosidase
MPATSFPPRDRGAARPAGDAAAGDAAAGDAAAGRPLLVAGPGRPDGTGLILFPQPGALPAAWVGPVPAGGLGPADAAALLAAARPCALLPEHGRGWFGRPGLSGHRLGAGGGPVAGRDWSPVFRPARIEHDGCRARVEAGDTAAGLRLVTEAEAVPGGAVRVRHTLANLSPEPYVLDSLEVVVPLPAQVAEVRGRSGPRWRRRSGRLRSARRGSTPPRRPGPGRRRTG